MVDILLAEQQPATELTLKEQSKLLVETLLNSSEAGKAALIEKFTGKAVPFEKPGLGWFRLRVENSSMPSTPTQVLIIEEGVFNKASETWQKVKEVQVVTTGEDPSQQVLVNRATKPEDNSPWIVVTLPSTQAQQELKRLTEIFQKSSQNGQPKQPLPL